MNIRKWLAAGMILLGLGLCAWGAASSIPVLWGGLGLASRIPALAGFNEPRTYLLLAQNRDELRATGGFITGIGTLRLENGRLAGLELGDSYRVDDFSKGYPPPPEALRRLMQADYWVPRDANWEPDFPRSARKAQELYRLSTGQVTQGVIAFDQEAVRVLAARLGPLQVEGFPEPVTAQNIEALMQQAWAPAAGQSLDRSWWLNRKGFMSVLGKALVERLKQVRDPGVLLGLAQDGLSLLKSGHLLVYLDDPAAQYALRQVDLDGALEPGRGDFLLWVDSNIGFNKTDAVVKRALRYSVDLSQPGQPTAALEVTFQHAGQGSAACKHEASYGKGEYADMQARCYWDYWRAYLTSGARLTGQRVQPVPGQNLLGGREWNGQVETAQDASGLEVFAGVLLLPPGKTESFSLRVALPGHVALPLASGGWRYSLRVQKQAGAAPLPLSLRLRVPPAYKLRGDGWRALEGDWWGWEGALEASRPFEVDVLPR